MILIYQGTAVMLHVRIASNVAFLIIKLNKDNLNFVDFHILWTLRIVSRLVPFGQFVSHVTFSSARWAIITSLSLYTLIVTETNMGKYYNGVSKTR